jgi:3-hydroxyisobutyrate dehydrogenase
MIAFLGMGLLGSNFVKALLRNGNQVRVWNRTHERALPLSADGAIVCEHILDAVAGVDRIHIVVKDDAAVDEVLEAASSGLMPNTTIIDHTTTSTKGASERTLRWKERGVTYLHVPVFMGPQNALESTGFMLVSGDQEVIAMWHPALSTMTGKVLNFGTETGKAAAMKLLGNLFLIALTGGLADMLTLASALGVPSEDLFTLFAQWNPAAMVPARLQRMVAGSYDQPSWELKMARKDAGLMMSAASNKGSQLTAITAIAALMDSFIDDGFGNKDWTVIGKQ